MLDVTCSMLLSAQAQQAPTVTPRVTHWQMSRLRPFNSGSLRVYSHTTRYHPTEHDAKQPWFIFVVSYCIAQNTVTVRFSSLSRTLENDSGTQQFFYFPDTSPPCIKHQSRAYNCAACPEFRLSVVKVLIALLLSLGLSLRFTRLKVSSTTSSSRTTTDLDWRPRSETSGNVCQDVSCDGITTDSPAFGPNFERSRRVLFSWVRWVQPLNKLLKAGAAGTCIRDLPSTVSVYGTRTRPKPCTSIMPKVGERDMMLSRRDE
jgi:hypothetical protein